MKGGENLVRAQVYSHIKMASPEMWVTFKHSNVNRRHEARCSDRLHPQLGVLIPAGINRADGGL
jgi:hypothetical protein